jgi:hypothetical protein
LPFKFGDESLVGHAVQRSANNPEIQENQFRIGRAIFSRIM